MKVVEPLPRWAKAFLAVVGLALGAGLVYLFLLDEGRVGDGQPARWRVDPHADLSEESRTIPIIVNENECASGRSAAGRISRLCATRPTPCTSTSAFDLSGATKTARATPTPGTSSSSRSRSEIAR